MSAAVTVELGRVGAVLPLDERQRGRIVHLPDRGLIVIAQTRTRDGRWRCVVIGRRVPGGRHHIVVSTADIDAGETVVVVDPARDPDGWVMAWQARVWRIGLGGRKAVFSRALTRWARPAGTVRLVLTPQACTSVTRAASIGTCSLRGQLGVLLREGLLSPVTDGDGTEAYELTIPDAATAGNGDGP